MRLSINNFAKIKKADILVDGITVIAGENNTGKSTIGKILFSMFNSMNDIEEKIIEQREKEIRDSCILILKNYFVNSTQRKNVVGIPRCVSRFTNKLREMAYEDEIITEKLSKEIVADSVNELFKKYGSESEMDEIIDLLVEKIMLIISLSKEVILLEAVTRFFLSVFDGQMNSLTQKSSTAVLDLEVKGKNIGLVFQKNQCKELKSEITLMNRAIYIDNPFVMDSLNRFSVSIMEGLLKDLLTDSEKNDVMDGIIGSVLTKAKLEDVYKVLQSVVNGEIVETQDDEYYLKEDGYEEPVSFQNLSTGLKSFVLLKMLLEKGALKEKDVLILDEPEIHLHPQWQVVYAELIVLLQKQFDLSIIVATHSPYFLDAINLYSIKHGIDKKVNYYLSSMKENCVEMELVTGQIDKIYKKMATPIQALDTLRYELNNS